jgi:hypothetical protein
MSTSKKQISNFQFCLSMAIIVIVLCLLTCTKSKGADYASTPNFLVYSHGQADEIAIQAEQFREEVAREWLGKPLSDGDGRSVIYVDKFTDDQDVGLTWAKDHKDRLLHNVWLTTSAERATGSTLHHEVAHTVFATAFPKRLPEWFEEGVASRYDDADRQADHRNTVRSWAASDRWPSLESLLSAEIDSHDSESYAASQSLVDYLAAVYGKPGLTRLSPHLRYSDKLQANWQAWCRENYR